MTTKNICRLSLCVLLLTPMAPFATAKAQATSPTVTGTDPQPISPNVTGTDPQPINPNLESVLLSIILA